jgi:hypothetical protein
MGINPIIYEINTRVFIKRFGSNKKLIDVPHKYWKELSSKGINFVWLMGIWKTCDSVIDKYCFEEGLIKSYDKALKNWKREDVVGSPFAIDCYKVNPILGTQDELIELKTKLNTLNIGLILDFIPNHFSVESHLLHSNPEIFLSVEKSIFEKDNHTYFQPFPNQELYYAHGRDPFFPAWQDTIQIDYSSSIAREYMVKELLRLLNLCDGVRCDMAMLALNNVFHNTWRGAVKIKDNLSSQEFWDVAIKNVKKQNKNFLFIAEAYWDLEWNLQQLGFDYTYDKRLTDRLNNGSVHSIREHLFADEEYQKKSLRFIENHDEERAVTLFGKEKSKAAAIVISTIHGMRFFYDGQFAGKRIKLPVQLGREPEEQDNEDIILFYNKLLSIVSSEIFRKGSWKQLTPESSWEGNYSYLNILAWAWSYQSCLCVVVVNYSSASSQCRIKLDVTGFAEELNLKDILIDQEYFRSAEEVYHSGLYIDLKPWNSHIFKL